MQSKQIAKPENSFASGNPARTAMTEVNRWATAIEMEPATTEPKSIICKTIIRSGNQTAAAVRNLSATTGFNQPPCRKTASTVVRLNYSVAEACSALGCGRSKLYDLIGTHQIAVVKLGRRTLIPIASLESFVQRLAVGQNSQAEESGK